ncbi:hypothetical protein [Pantoea sp. USHLN298]|uniref:hypothetical protein n=1 Tax=Pantoea sp. USHLN298 TaxID=3081294 RepID=UPI00301AA61C
MRILTNNIYFRIGLEAMLYRMHLVDWRIMVFDAGENIYILRGMETYECRSLEVYSVLMAGKHIRKEEIKNIENFSKQLRECQSKNIITKFDMPRRKIPMIEEYIVHAFCHGDTLYDISKKLNKNINTIRYHKTNAMRRLEVRTNPEMHKVITQWGDLLKQVSIIKSV